MLLQLILKRDFYNELRVIVGMVVCIYIHLRYQCL